MQIPETSRILIADKRQGLFVATFVMIGIFMGMLSPSEVWSQRSEKTRKYIEILEDQGVDNAQIRGVDSNGIPYISRDAFKTSTDFAGEAPTITGDTLPTNLRAYEVIPSVVRNDGNETFRLEVEVRQDVNEIRLEDELLTTGDKHNFIGPESYPIILKDNGEGVDRKAGDRVYTAGPFHYNTKVEMSTYYGDAVDEKSSSPEGIDFMFLGEIKIETTEGQVGEFLVQPQVGVVRQDIPATDTQIISNDVQVSSNFINLKTDRRNIQGSMHASYELREEVGYSLTGMRERIYKLFPDAFHFLNFVSTNRLETRPSTSSNNFYAGLHGNVRVDYTGTGDGGHGSMYSDKLLGVSRLDVGYRGINGNNDTHELLHQWLAYMNPDLGISTGSHYNKWASTASLLYGYRWIQHGENKFTLDCNMESFGVVEPPPMDLYMMGLIPGEEVPPIYVAKDSVYLANYCEPYEWQEERLENPPVPDTLTSAHIKKVVTIEDIQEYHGVRRPGPENSRKHYRIGYVGESHNRLMTETEMTFFNILARHRAKDTPEPNYHQSTGHWTPLQGYFGHGTSWDTEIPSPEQKKPKSVSNLGMKAKNETITLTWDEPITNKTEKYRILRGRSSSRMAPIDTVQPGTTTYETPIKDETAFYAVQPVNQYGNLSPKKPVESYLNESITLSANRFHLVSNALDTTKEVGARSDIYRYWLYYRKSGYMESAKDGYWFISNKQQTIDFKGEGVEKQELHIYEGWNLVGGLADTVKIASIKDPNELLDQAPVYTYDVDQQKYVEAEVMVPFSAYWVYGGVDNNDGEFDSKLIVRDITRESEEDVYRLKQKPQTYDQLTFTSGGIEKTIFYSTRTLSEQERLNFILPPKAPATALDVRTADGFKIADDHSVEIDMTAESYPVLVSLDKHRDSRNSYKLLGVKDGDTEAEYPLYQGTSVELADEYDYLYLKQANLKEKPTRFKLGSNYPNPFNPETTIQYQVPEQAKVVVSVYNVLGERVQTLVDEVRESGRYRAHFDGSGLASGVYILRMEAGDFVETQKMSLIK